VAAHRGAECGGGAAAPDSRRAGAMPQVLELGGRRIPCRWRCGADLAGRRIRAHFTLCPNWPATSDRVHRRARSSKAKRGRPRRRTHREPDACAQYARPAGSGHVDRRGWNWKAKRRSPPGRRMLWGGHAARQGRCRDSLSPLAKAPPFAPGSASTIRSQNACRMLRYGYRLYR